MGKKGTIVLDPGHGGTKGAIHSTSNNAKGKESKVLEKTMTLDLGLLTRTQLQTQAAAGGHDVTLIMTRETDVNLGAYDRSGIATNADLFLSIHFNGLTRDTPAKKNTRGVRVYIRHFESIKDENGVELDSATRVSNDEAFARSVRDGVFAAIQQYDSKTVLGNIFKDDKGVLNREYLGWKARACLLEVEFIDLKEVDALFNTSPNKDLVREAVAKAIATALITNLP
jgi:N-acetylmuramoyl-L-alanine amidase